MLHVKAKGIFLFCLLLLTPLFSYAKEYVIYDDILDYTADKATLKKPILEDLGQGIYTLPLILVKDQYPEIFAPYLNKKNQITLAEIEEVAKLVVQYGGVEQAKVIAQKITKKAIVEKLTSRS